MSERLPTTWTQVIEKESPRVKELEHAGIENRSAILRSSSKAGKIFESCAGGKASLRGDDAMASNRGIFRDPREIADSCFFPDDGIARRAAIDGGVGANFDAVLNNDPANPQRLGKPGRGKGNAGMAAIDTGLADACTRMH